MNEIEAYCLFFNQLKMTISSLSQLKLGPYLIREGIHASLACSDHNQ